ncbi:hypothetical protein ES707_15873 [subsurface metagenome]
MLTLTDIQPADLFETPPSAWFTKEITRLQEAKGFHWGMFVAPQSLIATESIEKGTALTRYEYATSYIYRIKALQNVSTGDILCAIADYGRSTYGMSENFLTAFNYLVNYWLPQYPWEGPPVPSFLPGWPGTPDIDKSFTKPLNAPVNCIQYIVLIAHRLGYDILLPGQLVIQKNLENSPYLEYLGVLEID